MLVGNRIIEFRPSAPLQSNTTYTAEFYLNGLVKTDEKFNIMPFQFSTIQQSFSVTLESLNNYEGGPFDQMQFSGYLLTADVPNLKETEQIVQASYEGKNVPLNWTHDSDRRKHFFVVDSLVRSPEKPGELILNGMEIL